MLTLINNITIDFVLILVFFLLFLALLKLIFDNQANLYLGRICLYSYRVDIASIGSKPWLSKLPYAISYFILWYFFTLLLCPVFQNFSPFSLKHFSFYDPFSISLILLTSLLTPICMYIGKSYKNYMVYCWLFLFMEIFLIFCFLTNNLLIFYISFEFVTALMFVVILFWGYEQRRSLASFYFFYFTFVSSLFFLVGIGVLYYYCGGVSWFDLLSAKTPRAVQLFVWWCFTFAFAVKIPMFPFHVWLPEAHVEAPTGGSILLAAILLKLGFYGFYRFLIPLFSAVSLKYSAVILLFALVSMTHSMLTAIRQIDAKRIVAYCSIAHMNLGVLALFSFTFEGLLGSTFGMIAHGFVSAGLFFLVGALYKRYGTRSLNYYGGAVRFMPLFTFYLFIFILGNSAFPLTINFIAEFQMLVSIVTVSYALAFLSILGIVLNLFASLMLFVKVCYGTWKSFYTEYFSDLNFFEFFVCYVLLFFILYLGVWPSSFLQSLNFSFYSLINSTSSYLYENLVVIAYESPKGLYRPFINTPSSDMTLISKNTYDFEAFAINEGRLRVWLYTTTTCVMNIASFALFFFSDMVTVTADLWPTMQDHNIYMNALTCRDYGDKLLNLLKTLETTNHDSPVYSIYVKDFMDTLASFMKTVEKTELYSNSVKGRIRFFIISNLPAEVSIEFQLRYQKHILDTIENFQGPKGSWPNYGKKILINPKYAHIAQYMPAPGRPPYFSAPKFNLLCDFYRVKAEPVKIFLNKLNDLSFNFFCQNSLNDLIGSDLERALRYDSVPLPSISGEPLFWPHGPHYYDPKVCKEYSSVVRYCSDHYLVDFPESRPAFFWYSSHKPVLSGLYEFLVSKVSTTKPTDGHIFISLNDALNNIVLMNEFPSRLALLEWSNYYNLPKTHLVSILAEEGYPDLPDFECTVSDAFILLEEQDRLYARKFTYNLHRFYSFIFNKC